MPVYLLAHEKENGILSFVADKIESGAAPVCFLSLFDALIEGWHLSHTGRCEPVRVLRASDVSQGLFRDASGHAVQATFHIGWSAVDGRLLLDQEGAFPRFGRIVRQDVRDPPIFEVDALTLEAFGGARELAGLYAWQESDAYVLTWDLEQLRSMVTRALDSIQLINRPVQMTRQVALFDPEAAQWHFLPLSANDIDIIGN